MEARSLDASAANTSRSHSCLCTWLLARASTELSRSSRVPPPVGRPAEKSKYTQEELKLMKTQDVGYVRAKAQAEASKVARLRAELHLIGGGAGEKAKHTVFVDDEAEALGMDAVEKLSALMVHVTDIAGPDEDEE